MSVYALPVQVFCLGGEMLYVLRERLRAQQIAPEKEQTVLSDILKTLFNRMFVAELFKPQDLYTMETARSIFSKLCNMSIMRLNETSMSKLFDLMVMSLKRQVILATHARQLLFITLNHLDTLIEIAGENSNVKDDIDYARALVLDAFTKLSPGQWSRLRHGLLDFLQDKRTKVSIFIENHIQDNNGRFSIPREGPVPPFGKTPGLISYFTGDQPQSQFFLASPFGKPEEKIEPERVGSRGTDLGKNIFEQYRKPLPPSSSTAPKQPIEDAYKATPTPKNDDLANPVAVKSLGLLSQLIGVQAPTNTFKFNPFAGLNDDFTLATPEPAGEPENPKVQVIKLEQAKNTNQAKLNKLMDDFNLDSAPNETKQQDEDDLLDLMDSAT
eukprot:m.44945 g.44945  ORF g.44945 m.44945 type:complete len:384 (+) comp17334_c0_seq3:51-1202(+)